MGWRRGKRVEGIGQKIIKGGKVVEIIDTAGYFLGNNFFNIRLKRWANWKLCWIGEKKGFCNPLNNGWVKRNESFVEIARVIGIRTDQEMTGMDYVKDLRKLVGTRPLILPGAVVLILNEQAEVLLQHRTDGDWGLPGGLMELGESLEGTAEREVEEETGLKIGNLKLVGIFSGAEYYMKVSNGDELYSVTAVYATKDYHGKMKMDPGESQELRFCALDKLPAGMTDEYRGFVEAYLEQRGD